MCQRALSRGRTSPHEPGAFAARALGTRVAVSRLLDGREVTVTALRSVENTIVQRARFRATHVASFEAQSIRQQARIVTGDFTGDGKTDVMAQYSDGSLRAWASTGDVSADNRLFVGSGALVGTGWATSSVPRILTGDINADGKTDILAQYADGTLRAWASTGDLSADARLIVGSGTIVGTGWSTSGVPRIVTGDVTGDGRVDLLAQYSDGKLRAYASTGDLSANHRLLNATALAGTGWAQSGVSRIR